MVLLKSVLEHITHQPLHATLSTYTCPVFRCLNLQSAFVAFCCILVLILFWFSAFCCMLIFQPLLISYPDFELLFIYTTLTF